jgi:hypothetical protein
VFVTRHHNKRFCTSRCCSRWQARNYRATKPAASARIARRCYDRKITAGLDEQTSDIRRLLREWRSAQGRVEINETGTCRCCGKRFVLSRRDFWVGRVCCSQECVRKLGAATAAEQKRTWTDPRRQCLHCCREFVTLRDRGYVRNPKHTKGYCSRACGVAAFHERRRLVAGLPAHATAQELRDKKNAANRRYRERVKGVAA